MNDYITIYFPKNWTFGCMSLWLMKRDMSVVLFDWKDASRPTRVGIIADSRRKWSEQ